MYLARARARYIISTVVIGGCPTGGDDVTRRRDAANSGVVATRSGDEPSDNQSVTHDEVRGLRAPRTTAPHRSRRGSRDTARRW